MRRPAAAVGSAAFFLAAPGVVAGLVPWWITRWRVRHHSVGWLPVRLVGVLLLVCGAALLVYCFVRFVVEGRGTPAPVAPTETLVVGGAYRYVRNPMYVAVVAIIGAQALVFVSGALGVYAVVAWAVMAAFVHWYEEPVLIGRFGGSYEEYRHGVHGWLPRVRPWVG